MYIASMAWHDRFRYGDCHSGRSRDTLGRVLSTPHPFPHPSLPDLRKTNQNRPLCCCPTRGRCRPLRTVAVIRFVFRTALRATKPAKMLHCLHVLGRACLFCKYGMARPFSLWRLPYRAVERHFRSCAIPPPSVPAPTGRLFCGRRIEICLCAVAPLVGGFGLSERSQ